jgi:hypothetical protein
MKKGLVIFTAMLTLSAFVGTDTGKKAFKKIYKIEGTWKMVTKRGAICEEWKKMDKNYLQSKGYIVKGNDTIINERVALTRNGADIFYTSTVEDQNNKQPIAFRLTKAEGNRFVFENPNHDFPKRIVYELVTADSLYAFVDDGNNESKKRQNFYYRKQ